MRATQHTHQNSPIINSFRAAGILFALIFGAATAANASMVGSDIGLTVGNDGGTHPSVMYTTTDGSNIKVTIDSFMYLPVSSHDLHAPYWMAGNGVNDRMAGLGVKSNHFATGQPNAANLNGVRPGKPLEGLRLAFTDALTGNAITVNLNAIMFNNVKPDRDDFNLTLGGLMGLNLLLDEPIGPVGGGSNWWYTLAAGSATASEFMIWGDDNSDNFNIGALDVTAVPIPAAVWLFGTGIVGLLGFARRRKATAVPA